MMVLNLALFACLVSASLGLFLPGQKQCVEVRTSMCRNLDPENYKWTSFPNFMNQTSYEQVNYDIAQYTPLLEEKCSEDMALFLCSVYVPMCRQGYKLKIPPCRSLCESARSGCQPLLSLATISWPDAMRCDQFPVNDGKTFCIPPKKKATIKPSRDVKKNNRCRRHKVASSSLRPEFEYKKGRKMRLNCDSQQTVELRKIRFFPHHKPKCNPQEAKKYVQNVCNGKQDCKLELDQIVKAAKCTDHVKAVRIKYKCTDLVKGKNQDCSSQNS